MRNIADFIRKNKVVLIVLYVLGFSCVGVIVLFNHGGFSYELLEKWFAPGLELVENREVFVRISCLQNGYRLEHHPNYNYHFTLSILTLTSMFVAFSTFLFYKFIHKEDFSLDF